MHGGGVTSKIGLSDEGRMVQGYFRLFQTDRCVGGWFFRVGVMVLGSRKSIRAGADH